MAYGETRVQIVETADQLFYHQGFDHTSFADIADALGMSRGNFYHHFKTKDEILEAVITHRIATRRQMLERWEIEGQTPSDRIRSFINILIDNRAKIKRFGCPIGSLSSELAKLAHPSQGEANELFTLFRTWLRRQFLLLGRKDDADDLSMHVLARSQGIAVLANAFKDEKFVRAEVDQLHAWLSGVECNRSR